jgi:hypothetical protein
LGHRGAKLLVTANAGAKKDTGRPSLNPGPVDFAYANVVVAPVVEAYGFRVGVSSHALRDFNTPAVQLSCQTYLAQFNAFYR